MAKIKKFPVFGWQTILMVVCSCLAAIPSPVRCAGDSLYWKITFPARMDTVALERIRIAGATDPAAKVRINGEPVRVYRHGAFVALVDLQEGWNRIALRAEKQGVSREDTIAIYRIPALKTFPSLPVAFDTLLIEPYQDVWLSVGDLLQVTCKGSPGGVAKFCLPGLTDWQPMSPGRDPNVGGIYHGSIRMVEPFAGKESVVLFQLSGPDSARAEIAGRGRVRCLPVAVPLVALCKPETPFYTAAKNGTVLGMLPDSVKLQITGKENGRYKVAFGPAQTVYIQESDLILCPPGSVVRPVPVSSPVITVKSDWIILTFSAPEPLPFIAELTTEPMALEVLFYGAYQDGSWITYPEFSTELKRITWSQPAAQTIKLRIDLRQKQAWGYRVSFAPGRIMIHVRRTPRLAKDANAPLSGLRVVIDPGHGGVEPGAISPTGIEEKTVNLAISKSLAQWLRSAGADVRMTRSADTTLSLRQRVDIARQHQAHIFLWIHNNSVGEASDPAVSGTSTYFTLAQNQDLAWTVYPHILRTGLNPFGRIQNSYYVTRTTDMLVLLVEGAFMSNPLDEQKLMDANFLRKMARAIYEGVSEFARDKIK